MAPDGDKIRVTARITKELDTRLHQYYTNVSPAIVEALELLLQTKEPTYSPDCHQRDTTVTGDLLARIGDMERQIEFLKRQIEIKDSQLDKQAYSLQSLIQVNSALNMKLLPEKVPVHTEEVQKIVEEPEITSRAEPVAATVHPIAKEIIVEDEPAKPLKEMPQHPPVKEAKKKVKGKPVREVACVQCGGKFSASSEKAKFCSGKCRTAYSRETKKIQS